MITFWFFVLVCLSVTPGIGAVRDRSLLLLRNQTFLKENPLGTLKQEVTTAAASRFLDIKGCPSIPLPPAAYTLCGSGTIEQLKDCCGGRDTADFPGAQLSGSLPTSFQPARNLTNFQNNPALCGRISSLPRSEAVHSKASPFILYNSNVQLDLEALGNEDSTFGPYMAMWLGQDGALAPNNLAAVLPGTQAYQVCSLLRQGSLAVLEGKYCRRGSKENCTCEHPGIQLLKGPISEEYPGRYFASEQEWYSCHRKTLELSFPNTSTWERALAVYEAHMSKQDPALTCSDCIGRKYRAHIWGITWMAAWPVSIVMVCLYGCYESCCSDDESACCPPCAKHTVAVLGFLGVHVYDITTNWLYVQSMGRAGNATAYVLNMWVLLTPAMFCTVAGTLLAAARCLVGCSKSCRKQCGYWSWFLAGLVSVVATVAIPALFTRNILLYCVSGVLCPSDIAAVTKQMLMPIILGQAYTLLAAVACKAVFYADKWDEDECMMRLWPLAPDIFFLLLQSIPQLGVQTWLWVEGEAMVSTATFVLSSSASVLGAVYSVTSIVAGAYSIGARSGAGYVRSSG